MTNIILPTYHFLYNSVTSSLLTSHIAVMVYEQVEPIDDLCIIDDYVSC